MFHVLLLALPVFAYAMGFFPGVAVTLISIVLLFHAGLRLYGMALLALTEAKAVPSKWDQIKIQWVVQFTALVGMYALWLSGPLWVLVLYGATIPPTLVILIRNTIYRSSPDAVEEIPDA